MSNVGPDLNRRRLLTGALNTAVGGAVAMSALALSPAASAATAASPMETDIWSDEYWAMKGDVKLSMYRKRRGAPAHNDPPLPVLFLAHGSTVSSRPTFDLTVRGDDSYSMMNTFAGFGFDVWTMDFEGYGRSSRTSGNSDIASGVQDLKAAAAVIERETGQTRLHVYGESSGSLRAASFAVAFPHHVRRLLLLAFTWTGQGSPTLTKRAESADYYKTHNRRPRPRSSILSIFTRDKPGTSDPAVGEAMADAELPFGDTVPSGTYFDMTTKLPLVDPLKLRVPVLIARGEYDGIATEEDLLNFFRQLTVNDRQFNVLPGASHSAALGNNRAQLFHIMRAFLDMPPRLDSLGA
jgi:alpha-beta hydrolase superfamily lysophospholipase